MPMFPDSGVPAGDAKNSIDVNTIPGCPELWYSTSRCQPRFDPAAANAMLAEAMNLIMKGEVTYDCANLTHLERAVRYIVQRGLPSSTVMWSGPFDYTAAMDPTLTRYNDGLAIVVIPGLNNQGAVRINIDGHGFVSILRNDLQPLQSGDLRAGVPYLISYWSGNFFLVGLAASQVPLVIKGGIDVWIRTDGSDLTGDGTANSPDKAFRTILGAWNAVGSRYAATPLFQINMRLGIPGSYEGAIIGPFGGIVTLTGDVNNVANYRIFGVQNVPLWWCALFVANIAQFWISGVTMLMDRPTGVNDFALRVNGSNVGARQCRFEVTTLNDMGVLVDVYEGGSFSSGDGDLWFIGNGSSLNSVLRTYTHGSLVAAYLSVGGICYYHMSNIAVLGSVFSAGSLSVQNWGGATFDVVNVTGKKHHVAENSILDAAGKTMPGTVTGTVATGGQFIP